jgi:hypothetical protein
MQQKPAAMKIVTPKELAAELGWSERNVRDLARRLGACRILGNRMRFLPEDVQAILEATRPCPSKSIDVREAMSGTTEARLPDIDSAALLAHLTRKPRKELRPRLKTNSGAVVSMEKRRR